MRSRSFAALAAVVGLLLVSVVAVVEPEPFERDVRVQSLTTSPADLPVMTVTTEVVEVLAVWPVPSDTPLTDGYGHRDAVYSGDVLIIGAQFHSGQDFAANAGTPIVSIAEGVVVQSGFDAIAGQFVKIDHGDFESFYGHMIAGSQLVSAGDIVAMGQQIGVVGSTGASTGAHLHFEVSVAGVPVDPLAWLLETAG